MHSTVQGKPQEKPQKKPSSSFDLPLSSQCPVTLTLPKAYESSDNKANHYPVVYVLDGQLLEGVTLGVLDYLRITQTQAEVIVVAIASHHRSADFTPVQSDVQSNAPHESLTQAFFQGSGGADKLLEFLTHTLIPYVDSHYRTQPRRTLIGYSLSGLFALYSLFQTRSVFHYCLAIDPSLWWHGQHLLAYAEKEIDAFEGRALDKHGALSLFLCAGNTPGAAAFQLHENAQTLHKRLETTPKFCHSHCHYFPESDHTSIVVPALYEGLRHLWQVDDQ
ncbi:alpha/beta hydrolase-fold protein [Porticoccaceae bacterium]|nr:alpha/beta hydrolase-fold protein [Porticoccaceae bacterium]